ncbi:GNAT family N-acetyltransferase [Roseateles depolymerans]|uniref:GNAT family N-acetyltransferase n=1 Tax=Roseateles depolymerans TaxID=76731 RepID=UPI0009F8DD3E|nr:GNAT family N-acetyltransferase [Roseateles depolymerans]
MNRRTHVPSLDLRPGDQVPADVLHALFREAFADYLIGPFEVPLSQWPAFLARQGADLGLSRVAFDSQGQALAFALVAQRPLHRRWRLATMGARPQARGTGAAAALLDDVLARAAANGQQAVELEVFAQNERARRLYESRGFEAVYPLHGWQADLADLAVGGGTGDKQAAAPQAVDLATALEWLDAAEHRWPDLPLQVTRASLGHLTGGHAWQMRPLQAVEAAVASGTTGTGTSGATAQLIFTLPDETVMVNSFIAPDPGDAQALLQALARVYPQRRLRVPQLQRDDLGGQSLRALGASQMPLHQLWMQRTLTPDTPR